MIKINKAELERDVAELGAAIEDFIPYASSFFSETIGELEGMNSDFVKEMISVIKNMKDSKATKLKESILEYERRVNILLETFDNTDEEISKSIKGEGSKNNYGN